MYGWRGKLGLLVPANNTVIEPELNRLLPPGTAAFATRMIVEGPFTAEALHRMETQAGRGIRELLLSRVDMIVYACMSTSLAKGDQWDRSFAQGLPEEPVKITTAARCTIRALQALGAKKVAVLTPYPAAIQSLVAPYFQAAGLEPAALASLDIDDYHAVTQVTPERLYRAVRSMDLGGAEAVCLLATDLRTIEAIVPLEQDLGIPVVSTNLAICWSFLTELGIREQRPQPECKLMALINSR
ncbi:MAG TPA: hypothetical protein GX518_02115 [Firmicutes bacterium]|nr:hypothetical protein [Bacillota bacterium]